MKKLLFASSILSASAFAAEWTGTIPDAKCGAAHVDASEKSMACVRKCAEATGKAVLVTDGKVVPISDASMAKIKEHLGHKVVVTGKMDGTTIAVDSVKML